MGGNSDPEKRDEQDSAFSFLKKVLIVIAIAVSVLLMVLFLGYAIDIILLVFIGILFGIFLRSLRDFVCRFTGIPRSPSLAIVVALLLCLAGGTGYVLTPHVFNQTERMYNRAPEEWNKLKRQLWQYSWGREIARENPKPQDLLNNDDDDSDEDRMTDDVMNLFSLTAGATVSIVFVLVIGVYIAAEPEIYRRGVLRLIPLNKRPLAVDILDEISMIIQWWIVGQMVSMIILGTITTLGLYLLGMPYSLILGLFTAFMTFIPNLGPVLSGIPTLLVALTVSFEMVLYVSIFYILIQSIEGYFITPMIHREMINVPPVLIIAFQFLLYFLIGIIGVFVAMPLVACFMIIIQRVYVEEILGDSMDRKVDIDHNGISIF